MVEIVPTGGMRGWVGGSERKEPGGRAGRRALGPFSLLSAPVSGGAEQHPT